MLGIQETKWKGDRGVRLIMNEEYSKEVIRVERWGDRIIAV